MVGEGGVGEQARPVGRVGQGGRRRRPRAPTRPRGVWWGKKNGGSDRGLSCQTHFYLVTLLTVGAGA